MKTKPPPIIHRYRQTHRLSSISAALATTLAAVITVGGLVWNASSIGSGVEENRRRIEQMERSLATQRLEIREDLRNSESRLAVEIQLLGSKVDAVLLSQQKEKGSP